MAKARQNVDVNLNTHGDREFPMTGHDFQIIVELANELTGIQLGDHKRDMIYGRLVRRIRALGMQSCKEYCDYLKTHPTEEVTEFVNAITTNLTAFFREPHHFDCLEKTVFPWLQKTNKTKRRVRIWSAGCSTGEEPYSIALLMKKYFPPAQWDAKLLATDLDSNVVAKAQLGVYDEGRIETVSEELRKKWFLRAPGSSQVKIKPEIQQQITFKQLNLLHQWPMKGPFDVIFCRNVVIYFDKATQRVLFDRYAELLRPDGYLFIGHSESLHNVTDRFESLGRTIYRRVK